jgi:hypothetical protein
MLDVKINRIIIHHSSFINKQTQAESTRGKRIKITNRIKALKKLTQTESTRGKKIKIINKIKALKRSTQIEPTRGKNIKITNIIKALKRSHKQNQGYLLRVATTREKYTADDGEDLRRRTVRAREKGVFRNEREVVQTVHTHVLFLKKKRKSIGAKPGHVPKHAERWLPPLIQENPSSIFNENNFNQTLFIF